VATDSTGATTDVVPAGNIPAAEGV